MTTKGPQEETGAVPDLDRVGGSVAPNIVKTQNCTSESVNFPYVNENVKVNEKPDIKGHILSDSVYMKSLEQANL